MFKKFFFLFFVFLFLIKPSVFASEYKVTYDAEYTPDLKGNAYVNLNIKLTNPRLDIYIKEYSIIFPKSFEISGVVAKSDIGEVEGKIEDTEKGTKIVMIFTEPDKIDRKTETNITLKYTQKNLFKKLGNVWELTLPAIYSSYDTISNAIFNLPENFNKISLAKPTPSSISGNKIYWNDIKENSIYALFGDSQFYDINLDYHLKNDKIPKAYFDIAFPPETLYQKIFVNNIDPKPELVYRDEDNNYLGRYFLSYGEKKNIKFNGTIQIMSKPQEELIEYYRNKINVEKKYLLTQKDYWNLGNLVDKEEIKNLKTVEEIYDFVSKKLNYNYKRINKDLKRLGAAEILKNPDLAVCMEFTDLFVAISREKGILSREINGYGFSYEQDFRPSVFISDILHSWPEYYNTQKQIWVPVDPTWENTSKIDYFNSFDLNHIVFAIHGKNTNLPVPAGMYKISDTKDIDVKPSETSPKENKKIKVSSNLLSEIYEEQNYTGKITIKNTGNTFIKGAKLKINPINIKVNTHEINIDFLAPFEEKVVEISYGSNTKNTTAGKIQIISDEEIVYTNNFKIFSKISDLLNKFFGVGLGIIILFLSYKIVTKKRK